VLDWAMAGAGLVMMIGTFGPWYGVPFLRIEEGGWHSVRYFGWFVFVIGLAILALAVLDAVMEGRETSVSAAVALSVTAIGAVALLVLLVRMAYRPGPSSVVGLGWGIVLATLGSLMAVGAAIARLFVDNVGRKEAVPAAPAPSATPFAGSGPPPYVAPAPAPAPWQPPTQPPPAPYGPPAAPYGQPAPPYGPPAAPPYGQPAPPVVMTASSLAVDGAPEPAAPEPPVEPVTPADTVAAGNDVTSPDAPEPAPTAGAAQEPVPAGDPAVPEAPPQATEAPADPPSVPVVQPSPFAPAASEEPAAFCPACGTQFGGDALFCHRCGARRPGM